MYSWWWVELSPETCRVKPLRRINAIVASCWIYYTSNKAHFSTVLGSNVHEWNKNYFIIRKSATWYNAIGSQHSTGNVAKKTAHRVTWKWPLCWNELRATGDRWNFNEGFKQVTEGRGGGCNCHWRTGNANTAAHGQFATNSHNTYVLTEITETSHWWVPT